MKKSIEFTLHLVLFRKKNSSTILNFALLYFCIAPTKKCFEHNLGVRQSQLTSAAISLYWMRGWETLQKKKIYAGKAHPSDLKPVNYSLKNSRVRDGFEPENYSIKYGPNWRVTLIAWLTCCGSEAPPFARWSVHPGVMHTTNTPTPVAWTVVDAAAQASSGKFWVPSVITIRILCHRLLGWRRWGWYLLRKGNLSPHLQGTSHCQWLTTASSHLCIYRKQPCMWHWEAITLGECCIKL